MNQTSEDYGGPFQFNLPPEDLEAAAREAELVGLLLQGTQIEEVVYLASNFSIFAALFRRGPSDSPTWLISGASPEMKKRVLRMLLVLARLDESRPTAEAWNQLQAAIVARDRAMNPADDDRP